MGVHRKCEFSCGLKWASCNLIKEFESYFILHTCMQEHIFSSYYMMENVEMGKVKTVRPTADFFYLSSTHSSLIGVIQSSSHPVAVRIKRELDFVNFANQDKKRSRKSSFSCDHENDAFLNTDKRTRTGESGDHSH